MKTSLSQQRLLIVTGKGGVGKSSVSAALALASALKNQRTLFCEINTEERISQFLGKSEVGEEITQLEENLWGVNLRPAQAMREYALMRLKLEFLYKLVFENPLVRNFLRFIPSLSELVMLGKLLYHVKETQKDGSPRFHRVIMDAPATGHAISFLRVPQVILETVPPGPMAKEARWMRDLLIAPDMTAAVLVTLPEEMPVNETLDLAKVLRDEVQVQPGAVILNGTIAPRFTHAEVQSLPAPLANLAENHLERALLTETSLQRLDTLGLDLLTIPRIFSQDFDRKVVESMAEHLAPLLGDLP